MEKKWIWVDPICVVGGVLLRGTNSCCFSMFFFAFLRLVSARTIFSHVLPCLFLVPRLCRRDLPSQQAAWEGTNISLF